MEARSNEGQVEDLWGSRKGVSERPGPMTQNGKVLTAVTG